uniref:Putative lipocalin-3 1 n=1 Tax=Amblyomma cajennense TaxID=34607 RepID=A0A023FG66_AMBCJ
MKVVMENQQVIWMILLNLLIFTVKAKAENNTEEEDIRKFFDQSERIWTSHSTAGGEISCKVDEVYSKTETSIEFNRYYMLPYSNWGHQKLFGRFRKWKDTDTTKGFYDTMDLSISGRKPAGLERIHYQNPNNKCAVVWILKHSGSNLKAAYDIRVKESFLKGVRQSDCWKELKRVADRRPIRRVYKKGCEDVI